MRRWLINVAKNETILIVAAILALISCFIVPPDADYKSYIHASTISQLICLMIVVCGFQRIGVFRIIGSRLLEKVSAMRGLVITLVALTFFSAMFITNDVALVTFVPFAVAVLIMAGQEDKTILVVTLMTIGANVGSMLTPIGNAHNLYLKALTGMPTMEFLGIMAPYSGTATSKPACWLPSATNTSPTRFVSPATAPVMAAGAPSSTRCCSSSAYWPSPT